MPLPLRVAAVVQPEFDNGTAAGMRRVYPAQCSSTKPEQARLGD